MMMLMIMLMTMVMMMVVMPVGVKVTVFNPRRKVFQHLLKEKSSEHKEADQFQPIGMNI